MAGTPKPMSQIKQLLILNRQGKGIKTIARTLGMSKNTVKTYLFKLDKLLSGNGNKQTLDALLSLDEPELYPLFHPGNPSYKDPRYEYFKDNLETYQKELKKTGVTRTVLWEEYRQSNPYGYSYSQFCFHLDQQETAKGKAKASMVLDHKPGEKLYIDFAGKTIPYIDRETGEVIQCQFFVACLPYSDYAFAMAIPSQTTSDFLYALGMCLQDLGGVPQLLVPDNLKAAVTKADRYEPDINKAMEDFANHYGTAVLPARVRKPQDKALVENQVKILYSRVYARLRNMQFFDITSLNEAIKQRVKSHNQTRMQKKPFCREEKFIADEKPLLQQLPVEPFVLRFYSTHKVAKNNHIYLSRDRHYYSVPHTLVGCDVKVGCTRSMVYIYHEGIKVAVHPRCDKQGLYSTVKEHLSSHHQHYRDRSPDYYKNKASKISKVFHEFVCLLFEQQKYPEQVYRSCDGLLSLARQYELDAIEKACRTAIEYKKFSYKFIQNIIENRMEDERIPEKKRELPKHNNLRGRDYYNNQQRTLD